MPRAGAFAIFSSLYPPHTGGVENFSRLLARALVARGDEVVVVTNDSERLGAGAVDEDGVEVVRLPCASLLGGRFPVSAPGRARARLLEPLRARRLDGVFVNAPFYPHSLLGMRLARERGLRPVVLEHGSAYLSLASPVLDVALHCYEHVVTALGRRRYDPVYYGISERSAAWLSTFGIRAAGVITNSIDAAAYREASSGRDFRHELGIGGRPLVAFVGRLVPEKGVAALVAASRDERVAASGAVVVLAGDGPLATLVESAEGDRLRWVGGLSREDAAALLGQADLMCLPSRSEGFATTLLEAAACGCPSLVTDVGGAREVVPDDGYGRILPSADPAVVAREICDLVGRRDELGAMGERCRERVEREFSWDRVAESVEAALLSAR